MRHFVPQPLAALAAAGPRFADKPLNPMGLWVNTRLAAELAAALR